MLDYTKQWYNNTLAWLTVVAVMLEMRHLAVTTEGEAGGAQHKREPNKSTIEVHN